MKDWSEHLDSHWFIVALSRNVTRKPQRVLALDPSQNRFRWQTRWCAPILDAQENFLDALHTHTVHPGLVRRSNVRRSVDGSTIWITLYFTPETATSTHVWATLHVRGRWAPRLLVRAFVWPFLRQVARQDQAILEQQQTLREYFPDRHAAVTALDIARPYIARAWGQGRDALPPQSRCTLYL